MLKKSIDSSQFAIKLKKKMALIRHGSLLSNGNMSQGEFYLEKHAAALWCQKLPFTGADTH